MPLILRRSPTIICREKNKFFDVFYFCFVIKDISITLLLKCSVRCDNIVLNDLHVINMHAVFCYGTATYFPFKKIGDFLWLVAKRSR